MTETSTQQKPARQKRLTLAFIYASLGPLVAKQLGADETAQRVFTAEITDKIQQYKKSNDATFITPVMAAFFEKVCSSAKTRPKVAQWICRQYLEHRHNGKPIQAEDLYKVGENIKYFDQIKGSEAFKAAKASPDILQYKTYGEFEKTLDPFLKRKAQKEILAEEFNMSPKERAKLLSETTILYDGPEGKVVVPHTPDASKYWGSNTKWCIAGKEYAKKYFPHYNQKSPVIMMLPAGQSDNKIALVGQVLWDSADDQVKGLPPAHHALMQKCLSGLSESARKGIMQWMPVSVRDVQEASSSPWAGKIGYCFNYGFDPLLWNDREFVREVAKYRYDYINLAGQELLDDRAFVLEVVKETPEVFAALPDKWKDDHEIALEVFRKDSFAMSLVSERLRGDAEFCLDVMALRQENLPHLHQAFIGKFENDRDIALKSVSRDGRMVWIFRGFWNDSEVMRTATCQNGEALLYASKLMKNSVFVRDCLEESDTLPFMIRNFRDSHQKDIYVPSSADLKGYQVAALQRMADKGDTENFQKYARHFKSTWGDAEKFLGANPSAVMDGVKQEMVDAAPLHRVLKFLHLA